MNGPSLPITLTGTAVEPAITFSFEEHDFGPCILHQLDIPPHQVELVVTNLEERDVGLNCLFDKNTVTYLSVHFEPCLLARGEEVRALFEFRPQESMKYLEKVVFEINGSFQKTVVIKGEGTLMRIELEDPTQKILNFGALRMNGSKPVHASKTVKLVNSTPTPLSPSLSIVPSSSIPALQEANIITIEPNFDILLRASGGMREVTITFSPKSRIPHFSEEVILECLNTSYPLLVVMGSCHGLEVSLDSEYIPFGAVVQDSSSSRKLLMVNSGDIGAAFHWKVDDFGPEFTISPKEGYISAGMQVKLFMNQKLNQIFISTPPIGCI